MSDIFKINRLKLNDELSEQASRFASAAEQAELLYAKMEKLDLRIELITDQELNKLKQKYRNVGASKQPSETTFKSMVRSTAEMVELKEQYANVSHQYRVAKIQVDAFKMRAEMMVSMAHNIRQEKKSSEKVNV